MIRVAICDGTSEDVERLEKNIETVYGQADIDVFYSGQELLHYLEEQGERYHLYILETELPDSNGIELARKIRESDLNCFIAFLTAYPNYVYEVFDVLVFDYIVKPISLARTQCLMKRAEQRLRLEGRIFYYYFKKVEYGIATNDIYLFQKNKRYIEIYSSQKAVIHTYMAMEDVMEQLKRERFIRISYSCIVNLKYIAGIEGQMVELLNGMKVMIARKMVKQVKKSYLNFLCLNK